MFYLLKGDYRSSGSEQQALTSGEAQASSEAGHIGVISGLLGYISIYIYMKYWERKRKLLFQV